MGLAASQARFLAITARKADCEFRSMQNAQQKLSISREMAQASADYQEAMNQTKLTWDFDDSGSLIYDLSYNLLMTPTELNEYNPYLITERNGTIVLNNAMYNAAINAGLKAAGDPSMRTEENFKLFMENLGIAYPEEEPPIRKTVADTTLKNILNIAITHPDPDDPNDPPKMIKGLYDPAIGFGATPLNKSDANINTLKGLTYQLKNLEKTWAEDGNNSTKTISDVFDEVKSSTYVHGVQTQLDWSTKASGGDYDCYKIAVNGGLTSRSLTMKDLLQNNVVFIYTGKETGSKDDDDKVGPSSPTDITNAEYRNFVNEFLKVINAEMTKILGVDAVATQALINAEACVRNMFLNDIVDLETHDLRTAKAVQEVISGATDRNGYVWGGAKHQDKHNASVGVSLSNMLKSYLTYFEIQMNGQNGYYAGKTREASYYVTDDPNYEYLMKLEGGKSTDYKKADFYIQLFNNLCVHGFTKPEKGNIETDKEFLENMLKNGNYFLSVLARDGYYYQDRYTDVSHVVEVKDEDAIARAEAEFSALKTKLNYKEEKIDLEMKNIDLELSALTTEYDTVKQMISKNVEKIFSQFQ